ncbi:MAG: ankyrin repeat domain-containing protein [Candidatus Obscuribacterales bacterium]|nr:ankyrin repeat domain-containing protein [Candidatus Obscuribacterales bacterium]
MTHLRRAEKYRWSPFNHRAIQLWYLALNLLFLSLNSSVAGAPIEDDQSRLFAAIDSNDLATVKRLVQAKPELKNRRLSFLAQSRKPTGKDEKQGFSPLDEAVWHRKQDVALFLLGTGAELDLLSASGLGKTDFLQAHPNELKSNWMNPTLSKLQQSLPPIHWAVRGNQPDAVRWLLAHGEKIDAVDKEYKTPLHRACESGNLSMVKLLVENKADLNMKGTVVQWSPLHFAAWSGIPEVVEYLLTRGMDVNTQDVGLGTPLHVAAGLNDVNMADVLLMHGANIEARKHEMWGITNGTIEQPGSLGATPSLSVRSAGQSQDGQVSRGTQSEHQFQRREVDGIGCCAELSGSSEVSETARSKKRNEWNETLTLTGLIRELLKRQGSKNSPYRWSQHYHKYYRRGRQRSQNKSMDVISSSTHQQAAEDLPHGKNYH